MSEHAAHAALAYIHILEAENARLQKENAILARTSDYHYWMDEGAFHLKLPDVHLYTKGSYTAKIVLCMDEGEGDWVHSNLEKFIYTYVTPKLPDGDLCIMDLGFLDITACDDTGVVFSAVVDDRRRADVRSQPIAHSHVRSNSFWGDSDDSDDEDDIIYGYVYSQHVADLFTEILKGAQSYTVTKHDS